MLAVATCSMVAATIAPAPSIAATSRAKFDRQFGSPWRVIPIPRAIGKVDTLSCEYDHRDRILISGVGQKAGSKRRFHFYERLSRRGRLDRKFGRGGATIHPEYEFDASSILLTNGVILVSEISESKPKYLKLWRPKRDGSRDSSFGVGGKLRFRFDKKAEYDYEGPRAIPIRDGRFAVVERGSATALPSISVFNSRGHRVGHFDGSSRLRVQFEISDISPTSRGGMTITGEDRNGVLVMKLDSRGRAAAKWGVNGTARIPASVIDPESGINDPQAFEMKGGVVHLVYSYYSWGTEFGFAVRLHSDGTVDTSWGSHGTFLFDSATNDPDSEFDSDSEYLSFHALSGGRSLSTVDRVRFADDVATIVFKVTGPSGKRDDSRSVKRALSVKQGTDLSWGTNGDTTRIAICTRDRKGARIGVLKVG